MHHSRHKTAFALPQTTICLHSLHSPPYSCIFSINHPITAVTSQTSLYPPSFYTPAYRYTLLTQSHTTILPQTILILHSSHASPYICIYSICISAFSFSTNHSTSLLIKNHLAYTLPLLITYIDTPSVYYLACTFSPSTLRVYQHSLIYHPTPALCTHTSLRVYLHSLTYHSASALFQHTTR